jgi:hypothetical protein
MLEITARKYFAFNDEIISIYSKRVIKIEICPHAISSECGEEQTQESEPYCRQERGVE